MENETDKKGFKEVWPHTATCNFLAFLRCWDLAF